MQGTERYAQCPEWLDHRTSGGKCVRSLRVDLLLQAVRTWDKQLDKVHGHCHQEALSPVHFEFLSRSAWPKGHAEQRIWLKAREQVGREHDAPGPAGSSRMPQG